MELRPRETTFCILKYKYGTDVVALLCNFTYLGGRDRKLAVQV
jgi:hypothetical protein